jgi:hypothetical protein
MSHGYAITARALDANSPRSSFEPLPPRLQRKIAVIERYGVIWTRGLRLAADLPCLGAELPGCPSSARRWKALTRWLSGLASDLCNHTCVSVRSLAPDIG